MASYTIWMLFLSMTLVGAQTEEEYEPCQDTTCGLDMECFHKYNETTDQLDAVCVSEHGFLSKEEQVLSDGHVHYKKQCPEYQAIGIGKDRLDCGPAAYDNTCTGDAECNELTELCCFNGCKQTCRKFWLSAHP